MEDERRTREQLLNEVSELRQFVSELRKSEKRYRDLMDNALVGVFLSNIEGDVLYYNDACLRMFGFETMEEAASGGVSVRYRNQRDRNTVLEILEQTGKLTGFEVEFVTKKEEPIVVLLSATLESGVITGMMMDITERKQADEALRKSENLYRLLAENASDVIWTMDMNLNYTYVSPSIARLRGITEGQPVHQSLKDVVSPRSYEMVLGILREELARETTEQADMFRSRVLEMEHIRNDGSTGWAEVKVSFLRDASGRPTGILGVTRDITHRKEADRELKWAMEKMRKNLAGTIQAVSLIIETRDPYTAGHQRKVSNLARTIAEEMGLPKDMIDTIRMAGVIHDIGKMSVPSEILSKPGTLTNVEMSFIKAHPQSGYDILKDVQLPYPLAEMVLQHHERLDGSGYPQGLKGGETLLGAKIIAIADVVEAISSHRPYRPAKSIDAALEEIEKNKGILYDEKAVEVCLELFRDKGFVFEPTGS